MTESPAPKAHIAHTLLSRAHSPDSAAQQFTERIKQKPLFLRPTSPSAADNRSRRRLHRLRKKDYFLRHQRPRPLSAREKRISGLYDLPQEECNHDIFQGLHALWIEYMQEILDLKTDHRSGMVTPASHGAKLVSADYHGAEVEVVRSRCASRVGMKGIVARDTKFTFVIVTEKDEVKSKSGPDRVSGMGEFETNDPVRCAAIPKEHSVFRFTVPLPTTEKSAEESEMHQWEATHGASSPLVFELHGSQFETRPVDRANKKFKWRNVDYL
ncbi:uncharacterized protein N7459_003011 [Penicillium hispanicum]|uniref:uncharacterized protein n=1 Tax=Penicillium hispanicum TaxID=1080232 RepID=UPI00253FAFE9|nr:uncharacterized protein N7459_003011 [Penicillium hispanicum]KAJ5587246.1 hypothetical protein N7459_003011 [Penicillium hispanicum]